MPISPFVANLRKKVGTDLLHLSGVSVVVLNDREEILLVHSKDTDIWMPIGGMIEPGEEPADAAVREVFEETGVRVRPERLAGVFDGPEVTYSNGDRVHYITIVFLCTALEGAPHAHDEENYDAKYFALQAMPPLRADFARNVKAAMAGGTGAIFFTQHMPAPTGGEPMGDGSVQTKTAGEPKVIIADLTDGKTPPPSMK